ncbi:putative transcription factor MYB-HB-like family [Arabidopsis thaliana]
MSRSCSQCGNNGHNSRTCPTELTTTGDNNDKGGGEKAIMLFGVRVTEASSSCFRKSVSMNNLSQFDQIPDPNPTDDGGYASDDVVHASGRNRERKRGTPWTEEEHRLFLTGLHKVGKGDWRGISRNFVKSRTPTQVASHAQKYFLRRTNQNRRRRRSSLFDITPDSLIGSSKEENQLQTPLELIRPVPIPIPIPPSRKMADLNLNKKKTSATTEMFPLSLNLQRPSSSTSSSSNEQKARGSRASGFEAMSSNGDSIMGVA